MKYYNANPEEQNTLLIENSNILDNCLILVIILIFVVSFISCNLPYFLLQIEYTDNYIFWFPMDNFII